MITNEGIFGFGSNFKKRYILDHKELKKVVEHCHALDLKIVLTQGSFDMVHIGHARYLEEARNRGDILIVGIDSDEKVRRRKGPHRPVVPEDERLEMLTHLRHVHIVTIKRPGDEKWALIKIVQPDTLIATSETYTAEELEALKEFCGEVVVFEPQAMTSTSAKIRRIQTEGISPLVQLLAKAHPEEILRAAVEITKTVKAKEGS